MNFNYSIDDIPYKTAYAAYAGNSMSPERRAKSEREGYVQYIEQVISELSKWDVEQNPERASLQSDIQRFIDGYKKRKLDHLYALSRHYSAFVAGPSNYPAERMRKRMNTSDKRMNELVEYCEKAIAAIHKKHNWKIEKPIESGELDALEKLRAKLAKLEQLQATMKAANKIARKKSLTEEEKIAQLTELDGISEKTARALLVPNMGQIGFESFRLTNNNANIRRLKKRIQAVTALQDADPIEFGGEDFEIYEDDVDNRIRIEFPGKPSRVVCSWLKSHGWNYSPRNTAWQRKITANARRVAQSFINSYQDIVKEQA